MSNLESRSGLARAFIIPGWSEINIDAVFSMVECVFYFLREKKLNSTLGKMHVGWGKNNHLKATYTLVSYAGGGGAKQIRNYLLVFECVFNFGATQLILSLRSVLLVCQCLVCLLLLFFFSVP